MVDYHYRCRHCRAESVVSVAHMQPPEQPPRCPDCGQPMRRDYGRPAVNYGSSGRYDQHSQFLLRHKL